MNILQVSQLRKSFGNTNVLKNINFSLNLNTTGRVLSIIGSSGSGKTTLLRCLNFLETPDSGKIIVNGQPLFDSDQKHTTHESEIRKKRLHFGLVFQSFNLFPQYTAIQNVTIAPKLLAKENHYYGKSKSELFREFDSRAEQLFSEIGLSDRKNNYPYQLSGGQCQRVAIARALMMKPDILCFDEPTSALDPELTGEVLKVIKNLSQQKSQQNTAMIIVTHEMEFARDVASQVIFMDNGEICEMGSPQQIFANPQNDRTKQFLSRYKN